ncbi:Telomerase-binding EST1A [Zalerion maritima]|uniref:Telomerase-binding EST1A n=1 Tax=Zalerion maritima TaxID=339359 RepID=A0AAD5RH02_9PEZI|nr:Telomerase-binding EST1A [Zalerion maritima]
MSSHSSNQPVRPSPNEPVGAMIRQPATRPISQEQLVAEVKGIYAGLVMVESKCIEVDTSQGQSTSLALSNEQWQALIALHRTLLHEHHDFFLASQHPSASPALRRLASKYAMPARMWRHGIHSFLELLRHRLPASLEHMLTFIYLAYSMMALLYETVPAFSDTWIECLGDLGRYRMAIEDDDIRDREVWTGVSRHWYSKASDKAPTTGRLYHHLAILARPNALQQLYYYCKSLCVEAPFKSAKDSILTLFQPVLDDETRPHIVRMSPSDLLFVRIIGVLFTRTKIEKLEPNIDDWINGLDSHIARSTRRWQEMGYYVAIVLCAAVLGFCLDEKDGQPGNMFLSCIQESDKDKDRDTVMLDTAPESPLFGKTTSFLSRTLDVVLRRDTDTNVLHFVHCFLVFVLHVSGLPNAMEMLAPSLQWKLMAQLLNTLALERPGPDASRYDMDAIPAPEKELAPYPLPEDYAMRGLIYTEPYYPDNFFAEPVDDEDKYFEVPSMMEDRKDRILSLGFRIARKSPCLHYNKDSRAFEPHPRFDGPGGSEDIARGVRASSEAPTEDSVATFNTGGQDTPSTSDDESMIGASSVGGDVPMSLADSVENDRSLGS